MTSAAFSTYAQTAIGILVSIVLFLAGYRQTIGARKERVRNANASLIRALLRRLVLEGYEPIVADLNHLIEGKAREFQVRPADLAPPETVITELFTTVFDSDLISPDQRKEIEQTLRRALDELEHPADSERPPEAITASTSSTFYRGAAALTVITALLGSFSSLLPQVLRGELLDQRMLLAAVAVFVTSVGLISSILVLRRTREEPSEIPPTRGFGRAAEFEARVAQALDKAGITYRANVRGTGGQADFLVATSRGEILLEIKAWPRAVPIAHLQRTLDEVTRLKTSFGAVDAMIVVPDASLIPAPILRNDVVAFVNLKELPTRLRRAV
jgi:hypothetical protein